ncbi:hypothetical protein D3C87_2063560 [compost metagenome]
MSNLPPVGKDNPVPILYTLMGHEAAGNASSDNKDVGFEILLRRWVRCYDPVFHEPEWLTGFEFHNL